MQMHFNGGASVAERCACTSFLESEHSFGINYTCVVTTANVIQSRVIGFITFYTRDTAAIKSNMKAEKSLTMHYERM